MKVWQGLVITVMSLGGLAITTWTFILPGSSGPQTLVACGGLCLAIAAILLGNRWERQNRRRQLTPEEETRILNEALFEKLAGTPEPESWKRALCCLRPFEARRRYKQMQKYEAEQASAKKANDDVMDFTRQRMREGSGFYRKPLPPLKIENDALDKQGDEW